MGLGLNLLASDVVQETREERVWGRGWGVVMKGDVTLQRLLLVGVSYACLVRV